MRNKCRLSHQSVAFLLQQHEQTKTLQNKLKIPKVRIAEDPLAAQLTVVSLISFYSQIGVAIPKTSATRQLKCTLHIVLYMIYLFSNSPIHQTFSGCLRIEIHCTDGYRNPGWEEKAHGAMGWLSITIQSNNRNPEVCM